MGFDEAFTFSAITDDPAGVNLRAAFQHRWPAYSNWYLSNADGRPRPSPELCRAQLLLHMPELVPTYDHLLHQFNQPSFFSQELPKELPQVLPQLLSLYNAPAFIAGCSQAVWKRNGQSALIRNYDFPHRLWDAMLLHSNWNGTRVIAMTDCIWGVLDGINEHGLVASLSFGGKLQVGDGFAITLVLRYILEFCTTVAEACAVLQRIPMAMAYNVVLIDRQGQHCTVFVGPGQTAQITELTCATNHQLPPRDEADLDIFSDSLVRYQFLQTRLADQRQTLSHLQQLFLSPPLYRNNRDSKGWGTIYTSLYNPQMAQMSVIWPNQQMSQSFAHFQDTQIQIKPDINRACTDDHIS